ncbi:RHS repeat-associated core domain-containing protein [Lentisphaerota bacterium WC36G]|nr:RHS repeat-associated core domain-containing protein [Lentisphaerae bacterium WC36]UDQ98397.1 RHS repeat-associated core domain-containing protein [Lentisphaerae bacterium WC36]
MKESLLKKSKLFCYIADGNKNITQLIDMSSGSVANRYDYSPFGQLSLDNETVANPFKFSSEYAEKETGLVYYNYRYYDPTTGKWLSRDPIEEDGGVSLYNFVGNEPNNYFDLFGLVSCSKLEKIVQKAFNVMEKAKKKRGLFTGGYTDARAEIIDIFGNTLEHWGDDAMKVVRAKLRGDYGPTSIGSIIASIVDNALSDPLETDLDGIQEESGFSKYPNDQCKTALDNLKNAIDILRKTAKMVKWLRRTKLDSHKTKCPRVYKKYIKKLNSWRNHWDYNLLKVKDEVKRIMKRVEKYCKCPDDDSSDSELD